MTRRRGGLLIIKTGSTLDGLRARRGDFEDWIAATAGLPLERFDLIDVGRGAPLPDPLSVGAAIVTGSPDSVADRHPWSESTASWLRDAVSRDLPVLGICYGHQLIAHALGGRVGRNPSGREIGMHDVNLLADDPLFEGLGTPLAVYETHSDAVLELPAGARRIAGNAATPIQALAVGRRVRGVQWHPEFDADVLRGYLDGRRHEVDADLGRGAAERLRREVVELPHGGLLLRNFLRRIAVMI